MMKRFLLLFSLFALSCFKLGAFDRYRVYDVRSGLSENSILDMFQDSDGYMWFATKDGLNRFNGYTFDVFKKNIDGVNLKIDALLPHRDGRRIWVGSDYRLLLFDPVGETFAVEDSLAQAVGIQSLCYDDGDLWVAAESGVFRWDGQGSAVKYDFETVPQEYFARVVVRDSHRNIWLGFGSSIYRYIKESDRFIRYNLPSSHEVTAIHEYEEGTLLVGTDRGDVYSFCPDKGGGVRLLAQTGSRIHAFQREIGGRDILIGSDAGLYVYDDEPRHIRRTSDALGHESIYGFYVDREGALWVGTYFCGVFYRQPRNKDISWYYDDGSPESLNGNAVSDMCEDSSGNLWIATENGGLNYLDTRTRKIKDYTGLSFSNIHALCLDSDRLYIGTFSNGMDVMDLRTGTVRRYVNSPSDPRSLINDFVYSVFKSSDGTIYVGTMKGVCTFDSSSGVFTPIKDLEGCFICDMNEDNDGNIWCADKNEGVYCRLASTGQWVSWTYPDLPSSRICGIFIDADSDVWLCTNGAGVCRYDKSNNTFSSFLSESDLPGVCYQMLQDEAGFYWVSSNSGLFRFGRSSDKVRFYTVEDGLQSNQFNYNSALKTSDGRLWFGGVNGLNSFDPLNLSENTVLPNVRIASVTIASDEVFGKSERLPLVDGRVRIPHDITSLDITFDVLSNIAPGKNRVAYIIDEITDSWDYTPLRTISLVKLSPGTYTLRAKACNNDGYWSEEDAILKIEVLPHPLESLPARIIYVVLTVGLAVLVYKLLDRNMKRRKAEELRIIELNNEKEIIQSKMTFFTNVAHEIKTPVTLISAPLDKIIETKEWNEETEANLHLMKKNSDRLLNLVKQLLDFRKIEKDSFKLTFSTTDVNIIVSETAERFRLMRQNVQVKVELSQEGVVLNADSEALVKVVSNLLANAVKYTVDSVVVKVARFDDVVQISVTDNGPGIPEPQQGRIFDMFYQVNPGKANGFGVGLSLVKHLVELHGGRVYVNGEYRQGCQMVVELPDNIPDSTTEDMMRIETDSSDICILVVEDTRDMQDFIVGNIGKEFSVLRADNGAAALGILEEEAVDIVISDLYMPEMDGLELLEKVRSNQQISHTPFILLTAQDSVSTKIKSLEYGSDAYIEKPFSMEHLRATVNNLIARRDRIHRSFQTSIEITMDKEHIAGPDSEWLSKINNLILKNISNDTYNVDELAGDMSVSRTVLQRKLKGLTGSTPNDYIRLIRLKRAAELLSQGGYRVNEVCYLVGFNSPSYFTKCFIQQFGMKPKDFRLSNTQKRV